MNLLVDIGNTRVKWARAVAAQLTAHGVFDRAQQPDWAGQLALDGVVRIVVASVADTGALTALTARAAAVGVRLQVAVTTARMGDVINAYARPERLGVDRWMACLAGYARGPGAVLVADAGTAITLDWVAADGRHGGGLIAPGVISMRAALRASTQLRPADAPAHSHWLASDTDAAIATGTLRSATALLDNAVRELAPDRLLLTGGEAALLAEHLAHDWQIVPQLVLEGLARYAMQDDVDHEAGQIALGASE